jgi:hypothetical protein
VSPSWCTYLEPFGALVGNLRVPVEPFGAPLVLVEPFGAPWWEQPFGAVPFWLAGHGVLSSLPAVWPAWPGRNLTIVVDRVPHQCSRDRAWLRPGICPRCFSGWASRSAGSGRFVARDDARCSTVLGATRGDSCTWFGFFIASTVHSLCPMCQYRLGLVLRWPRCGLVGLSGSYACGVSCSWGMFFVLVRFLC